MDKPVLNKMPPPNHIALIITAAITGVLLVALFLVPTDSPWMMIVSGGFMLVACAASILVVRYGQQIKVCDRRIRELEKQLATWNKYSGEKNG